MWVWVLKIADFDREKDKTKGDAAGIRQHCNRVGQGGKSGGRKRGREERE